MNKYNLIVGGVVILASIIAWTVQGVIIQNVITYGMGSGLITWELLNNWKEKRTTKERKR